ncbi:MAG: cupredoxin domain-containing protein [Nocardioidaceae bacterium]
MNRTTRVAAVTATALIGLSGLAACGSSSDSSGASAASTSSSSSSSAASSPSAAASSPAASSSAPSASASKSAPATKTAEITIKNFKYSGTSSVAPGTKITVTNNDTEAHTVTADTGSAFDVKIDPGTSATFTAPGSAGSYAFHCTYHSNMHGMLKVA